MEPVQQKFFPSQEKEEKVILLLRKHWFNYVIFFLLDGLIAIPLIIFTAYWVMNPTFIQSFLGDTLFVSLSIFVLIMLAAQLYGFVDYYLDVYIVTNQRIVDISQGGFFKRQISELHLHQVQDVNASADGLWGTLLHFGDVHIQTAGERANFVFKSIPHPYLVAKRIIDLHQSYIVRSPGSKRDKIINGIEADAYSDGELPYGRTGLQPPSIISPDKPNSKKEGRSTSNKTNPGIPGSKDGQKKSTSNSNNRRKESHPQKTSQTSTEGQLEEGREIDLES